MLRTYGNQHEARGMPVAWNCVLALTAATYPKSCEFACVVVGEWRRRDVFASRHWAHANSESWALESFISLARHENMSRESIRHQLERPNMVLSRTCDLVVFVQKGTRANNKQPSRKCPERHPRGLYFWAYLDFVFF